MRDHSAIRVRGFRVALDARQGSPPDERATRADEAPVTPEAASRVRVRTEERHAFDPHALAN